MNAHKDGFLSMQMFYHFPESKMGHTYQNANEAMNSSINTPNLDIIGKQIGCTIRWYASNRPFSYSTKEPGSSDIFIQFYTRGSIEWR